jgi:hypothetical protein
MSVGVRKVIQVPRKIELLSIRRIFGKLLLGSYIWGYKDDDESKKKQRVGLENIVR